MSFAAILFDCDGVLVDSEIVGLEDTAEFLRQQGFDWGPEDLIRRFTGMRIDKFAEGLREAYQEVLGRPCSDEELAHLVEGIIEVRRASRHHMQIVPQALKTVRTAQERGFPMAVASSSAQEHLDRKVNHFGFAPFFGEHVYSADYVEHGKPFPDIFLFAAQKLGVAPENCLVIEDSVHGVTAGVRAGATVWGFTGGGHCLDDHAAHLSEAGAVRIIETHDQLALNLSSVL